MIFNNVISSLREWCFESAQKYRGEYDFIGGKVFCGYLAFDEFAFKLSMLTDREFASLEEFKDTIKSSLETHYDYYLSKPLDEERNALVRTAINEFLQRLDSINGGEMHSNSKYQRVIIGEEAETLIARFDDVWHYDTSYWFLLNADFPEDIPEKIFVMYKFIEPCWDSVRELAAKEGERVYCYGEHDYLLRYCEETEDMMEYCGEHAYTDKSFSWFIYFSHEGTVAFAGSIVPKIKKLIPNELINRWDFE